MKYNIMRLICMFDLPVDTETEKRAYRDFRKNLIKMGFVMMQYSVYVRTCPSREYMQRVESKLKKIIPISGNVRLLEITEKQYNDMKILVGSKSAKESAVSSERLIII
jgi:CRISPR-associated protein Cas2